MCINTLNKNNSYFSYKKIYSLYYMPPKKNKITQKPWTAQHVKKFNWLYNWFSTNKENVNKETFIDENKRQLLSLIEKNENWSNGSKEGLLFMIARYLYNKNNKDRYIKLYSEAGYQLLKDKENLEQLNQKIGRAHV